MMILATVHNDNIRSLSDKTWEGNKVKYAEKHGYGHVAKTDDWRFAPHLVGWERIQFLIELLEEYPDTEWVWMTGADSIVTNFNTKIEDKIIDTHDIIVCGDFNEILVNDSMLIRNTPRAKAYLQGIMDSMPEFINHRYSENGYMIDTYEQHKDVVKLMPQRYMNSYEYRLYAVAPWNYTGTTDKQGTEGQWQPGDWLVHWPGTQLGQRMELVEQFLPQVIYE